MKFNADPRIKGPLANPAQGDGYGEGEVSPLDALDMSGEHERRIVPLNPIRDLMALRAQFPFLPVMPFPRSLVTAVLAANTPQDLQLADGTTVVRFFSDGDFYLSVGGAAVVPTSTNVQTAFSLYMPTGVLWYARGLRTVSVVSATADRVVQAHCYITDSWPGFARAMAQEMGAE
jgi:hypothetical protein